MVEYVKGDIFDTDCDVICHQVNCKSVMGSGIAYTIRNKYPKVYTSYKKYCDMLHDKLLGCIQPVECDDIIIVNLFSQDDYGREKGRVYTDYDALDSCLEKLYNYCSIGNYNLAIPYRMSCRLAGGDWNIVKGMIDKYFKEDDFIYCKIYIKE